MTIDLRHAKVQLSHRHPLSLVDARGSRLRTLSGTAWVTIDGDRRDWVLEPGDELVLASDARVLVMALGRPDATVEVCTRPRPAAPGWLARWPQALAGLYARPRSAQATRISTAVA